MRQTTFLKNERRERARAEAFIDNLFRVEIAREKRKQQLQCEICYQILLRKKRKDGSL